MHALLSLVAIAIASNVDNIGIGLTYGFRKRKIPFAALLVVAVLGGIFSFLSAEFASWMKNWFPDFLGDWFAGGILIFLGMRTWMNISERQARYQAVLDKKWWFLGLGLSVNNLGMGLSGGFLDFPAIVFGAVIGVVSGLALWLGSWAGRRYTSPGLNRKVYPISAVFLIAWGIMKFF